MLDLVVAWSLALTSTCKTNSESSLNPDTTVQVNTNGPHMSDPSWRNFTELSCFHHPSTQKIIAHTDNRPGVVRLLTRNFRCIQTCPGWAALLSPESGSSEQPSDTQHSRKSANTPKSRWKRVTKIKRDTGKGKERGTERDQCCLGTQADSMLWRLLMWQHSPGACSCWNPLCLLWGRFCSSGACYSWSVKERVPSCPSLLNRYSPHSLHFLCVRKLW